MKIEIEFTSSYEADVTIDGRRLRYGLNGRTGAWSYQGTLSPHDRENTIGGMVAMALSGKLITILQGHTPDEPNAASEPWGTWETLTETAREEVAEAMDSF